MVPEDRLASLGLSLPAVSPPVGSYVPALVLGTRVLVSGQLPLVGGALKETGVVGPGPDQVSADEARECARIAALNALAAIAEAAGGLGRVARIVRVTGYVASDPDFTDQPTVVNGASDLMVDVFGERGRHARSAVGVAALPLGAPVEIEVEASL